MERSRRRQAKVGPWAAGAVAPSAGRARARRGGATQPARRGSPSACRAPHRRWGRGVAGIFAKRKLDAAALDETEDILIQADLGVAAATRIRDAVGRGRYDRGIEPQEVETILAEEIERSSSRSRGR